VRIPKEKHSATVSSTLLQALPVFIFRDTRDVLVSHFHWARHGHENLSSFARDDDFGAGHVVREQNVMLAVALRLKAKRYPLYVIFYENLSANPVAEAKKLAGYIGMRLTSREFITAVDQSSFDAMRDKEKKGEMDLKIHPGSAKKLAKNNNPSDLFGVMTRKGVAGGWRDEIDAKTLVFVEDIMRKHLHSSLSSIYLSTGK
jgi:hypothetical protein